MTRRVVQLLNNLPPELRKKLEGARFIVEKDVIQIGPEGNFIDGQYFRDNSIIIYESLIRDDNHLKKVIIHELCHHFGMNERQVIKYLKDG